MKVYAFLMPWPNTFLTFHIFYPVFCEIHISKYIAYEH